MFWLLVVVRLALKLCHLLVYPLTIESFPLSLRNNAFNLISFVGRLGTIGIPIICVVVYSYDQWAPFVLFGVIAVFLVIASAISPGYMSEADHDE